MFNSYDASTSELPVIYTFPVSLAEFANLDILTTFQKILTDATERVHGLSEDAKATLWDSCLYADSSDGLITLLAKAMSGKKQLFIVYISSVGVLRVASADEEKQIRTDYKERGFSSTGTWFDFSNFRMTELLSVYSGFEYTILCGLDKSIRLSSAIQLKVSDLRGSVASVDAAIAINQAIAIAKALGRGRDVMIDSKDVVQTAQVDITPTEKAIEFLDSKRAYILGLPVSYLDGIQTPGMGSTGEQDTRATERGLKHFFLTILYPAFLAIFDEKTEFRSQDFRQMATAIEALKSFTLTDDALLSVKSKREILSRLFELDEDQTKENEENVFGAGTPIQAIASGVAVP